MKINRRKSSEEKTVLTAMIVEKSVLGRIAAQWPKQGGLFASKYANLIAGWCIKFYNKYDKAPGPNIERIFESWAASTQADDATLRLVERQLGVIDGHYKEVKRDINSDYILDVAGKHFNKLSQRRLIENLENAVETGQEEDVERLIANWGKVELGVGAGVDLMQDSGAWADAFAINQEPLVTYPGDLGKFLGNSFQRDGFIAFTGPEKRGKSFWLLDIAYRAMCQRRRVALFEVGDMSQHQVMERWGSRAARKPIEPCEVNYPKSITYAIGDDIAEVEHTIKQFDEGIGWREAYKACQKVMSKTVKSKKSYMKLSCHPNSSINVSGIRAILDGWAREGWLADVVVIDYADILAPPTGIQETRDQINATWKLLRRLSQELHCLVVTATQADAASYGTYTIKKRNFSEDKRKHAHVTGMLGINQTEEEEELGIMRLNWVDRRNAAYRERHCCHVAGCLALGMPVVCSTL